jgi:hypothetical protein
MKAFKLQKPYISSGENMSQAQAQFQIDTYGSCRHSEVVVIHPKRIDLRVYTNRRGEHIVDLGIIKIKYVNHDSSKTCTGTLRFWKSENR